MNLKQKSIIITLSTIILFSAIFSVIIYSVIIPQFQKIENQRVERNNRRVMAILEDRLNQIDAKLADWTIWDDTYIFLQNKNKEYIKSNLSQESFSNIEVDEALFINSAGELVTSFITEDIAREEEGFAEDLYKYFATGSALIADIKSSNSNNKGFLRTDDGLVIFSARQVVKSDGSGIPSGAVVFARYLDSKMINSMKELTQFAANIYLWDDPSLPSDYRLIKNQYEKLGTTSQTIQLDKHIISGYVVVKDIFEKPQAIVRTDIERDVSLQGTASVRNLAIIMVANIILMSVLSYWLLTGIVLKKISRMTTDVESLGKTGIPTERLKLGKTADEVDKLRAKINDMLGTLQKKESLLTDKEQFIQKVMNGLTIGIAVNEISTGKTVYVNEAFEKIYGWPKEKLTSVDEFFKNVYPDLNKGKEIREMVIADIASGDVEKMKWNGLEITKETGEKRFINAKNVPLPDQDLMVSTVEDVTEEKIESDKKEEYSKELERLNEVMVDRELKMIKLKEELQEKDLNNDQQRPVA